MSQPTKEINLAKPNKFDGMKEYARRFLSSCEMYLHVNKHIYDTDKLKINFILPFMQTKSAGDWAINRKSLTSAFALNSKGNKLTTIISYGTWTNFVNDFKTTFITTNDANEAQQALLNLKQTGTIDDFNNQFQSLITHSGISSPKALIALYQAGLTIGLLKNIYNHDVMPATIEDWYKAISQSDNIYHCLQAIQGPPPTSTQPTNCFCNFSNKGPHPNQYNLPNNQSNHPPQLTPEEQDKCFKEGQCLTCREKGHNSHDCTKYSSTNTHTIQTTKQTPMNNEPLITPNPPTTPIPNSIALQICQLINTLKDEEKEELFNAMDKQDF
ncbi:hypothetical protein M0805_002622 [Coniferiporia weirii]|nr:hypothetical protein M0805_002622 [Coniferiporia weirii]